MQSDRVQYSVNESYSASWDPRILDFVENKKRGPTPIPQRYVGTFIADFHRTLMYGGIFLYPANKYSPAGKLRLLYECNPAAFLMSQAGGLGSTGRENVLEMKPRTIHDRCPIYLGAVNEIDMLHEALSVPKLR
eukprot:TRINITY_DN2091_c0_g1_i1.p1 TRINITY_DN2091_c0_g1~~TRINITY_DN2091_c0_g1_i1.p1  ORF type:complete len:134 (+),score=28.95 TRINITY_DN2091_c0_g1_i1:255-656(+)